MSQGGDETATRRQEALRLSDELLSDIELSRIDAVAVARKASRLVRLLDDAEASQWLSYEVSGYPTPLDGSASSAAARSSRQARSEGDAGVRYWTGTLSEIESQAKSADTEIAGLAGAAASSSNTALLVERDKLARLDALRHFGSEQRSVVDKVMGSIHAYVAKQHQELRFGASVESAFEVLRSEVDAAIGELVPEALPMLTAAFENATSGSPEHWANAASTCRRLLKTAADRLRAPGPPVRKPGGKEIQMGPSHYVNRLVAWVEEQGGGETALRFIEADLVYLGNRLDAVDQAGQKGAHASVSRVEASRFITGTYLLLGDLLRLKSGSPDLTM